MSGSRARDGMVLLLALLCLLALEVTAVGVHFVVLQELRTARAVGRTAQLRLASQAAVSRALVSWTSHNPDSLDSALPVAIPQAQGAAAGGIAFSATFERLADDLIFIRGFAESPLRERAGVGALVALASPGLVAGAARAAIVTTGFLDLLPGSAVGGDAGIPAALDTSAISVLPPCAPVDAAVAAVLVSDSSAVQHGGGMLDGGLATPQPGESVVASAFGHLSRDALSSFAIPITVAAITPAPTSTPDRCDTARMDNWGEPGQAVAECAAYLPIMRRTGDLEVIGGRGQGILSVDGNLILDGARFDGIVLVRGSVHMIGNAAIRGVLLVEGDVRIEQSSVRFDRCAVIAAVRDIRVRGPFRAATRTWIPLF